MFYLHTAPLPLKDKVRIVTEYCLNLEMGECVTYADQFRGLTDACCLTLLAGTDGLKMFFAGVPVTWTCSHLSENGRHTGNSGMCERGIRFPRL